MAETIFGQTLTLSTGRIIPTRWVGEQHVKEDLGFIPSFCTACYREGRTGDRFMQLVKSGKIACCCQPNALMTLKEYLEDYASPDTKAKGERLIAAELNNIPSEKVRRIAEERLALIHSGQRDFRF